MVLALVGCGSSGSTKGSAPTGGAVDVKEFCDDLRQASMQAVPPAGSPMMESDLTLFDRLLDEAPAAVRGSVKSAHDAIHAQADKVTADGMKRVGDAMKKADSWASKNCPADTSATN
ncbi:MAG: hypothetical protein HOV83_23415 [Catenulispora sp.]|nr:hypothetical protein [Catenulispora sp.]